MGLKRTGIQLTSKPATRPITLPMSKLTIYQAISKGSSSKPGLKLNEAKTEANKAIIDPATRPFLEWEFNWTFLDIGLSFSMLYIFGSLAVCFADPHCSPSDWAGSPRI